MSYESHNFFKAAISVALKIFLLAEENVIFKRLD